MPAVVFGGIYVAAKTQPRTTGNRLLNEAETRLDSLERELGSVADRIESETDRLGPNISGSSVNSVFKQYEERIHSLRETVEETRNLPENQRELQAQQLIREDISDLESEDFDSAAESAVRGTLTDWLQETYGSLEVHSDLDSSDGMDQTYNLENHRTYRFIEIETAEFSRSQSVTEIDELADDLVAESVSATAIVDIVNQVDSHVTNLRSDLTDEEASFKEDVESVRREMEMAFDQIEKLHGEVQQYVNDAYRHGAVNNVEHAGTVISDYGPSDELGDLDRAIKHHLNCRFEDAERSVTEANKKAKQFTQVIGFLNRLMLTIDDELSGMDLPEWSGRRNPFFTQEFIERGINARLDGVRLNPDWNDDWIDYQYQGSIDTTSHIDQDNSESDGTPDYLIQDGVRWLFGAIQREDVGDVIDRPTPESDMPSNIAIEVHKGTLPESKADPLIMRAAADHIENESPIDGTVDRDRLPGTLAFEVETEGDLPPTQSEIGKELQESFSDTTTTTR
jgi:gas vesicle protein